MNTRVLTAVLKRNFVNYFANPTGYVFVCVFVILCAIAAFWPHEFFNRNLANLDQLSSTFPLIMLIFIPAITMSVWADERRQGTDELLLTIPAPDFDIVLGKYLAALAIFTVSLLLSLVCNYWQLYRLGEPDPGLFASTYFGYWLIGAAMLGVGMVASFLTSNLTVAYVLGVLLNAPLVLAMFADWIFQPKTAILLKQWSLSEQFRDFGRGVLSLSGLAFFGMIVALCLYLSMVFIGRRHWKAGQAGMSNAVFYPLLHLLWLGSFATFAVFLMYCCAADEEGEAAGTLSTVLSGLAIGYLALHGALLWAWSAFPRQVQQRPVHFLIPAIQAGLLGAFITGAVLVGRSASPDAASGLMIGLFIVYALAHAALAIGWWRFPHHVSLLPGHYILRFLSLALLGVGLNVALRNHDARLDVTQERLSSLSPATIELLDSLATEKPVQIEAFVSPEVPELYVRTRLSLISTLREIEARAGSKVQIRIIPTEPATEEANIAERRYRVTAKRVVETVRGTPQTRDIFLGVAFSCGTEKRVVPFLDRGLSPEYELVRALVTLTRQKRKRVGVLLTDVPLINRLQPESVRGSDEWPIVEELRKQYDVVRVDPSNPIDPGQFDVLLAVQPSSLETQKEFDHFLQVVGSGMPTAIFEDPFPFYSYSSRSGLPGTAARRRSPGGALSPRLDIPKADNTGLWKLLEVRFSAAHIAEQQVQDEIAAVLQVPRTELDRKKPLAEKASDIELDAIRNQLNGMFQSDFSAEEFKSIPTLGEVIDKVQRRYPPGSDIAYQKYCPFPKLAAWARENPEQVFLDKGCMGDNASPFNQSCDITSNLQHLVFLFPGFIEIDRGQKRESKSALEFMPLVSTGQKDTGTVVAAEAQGHMDALVDCPPQFRHLIPKLRRHPGGKQYVLAARIRAANLDAEKRGRPDVVLVADIDMFHQDFFKLRAEGENLEAGLNFDFDNVTFVLNVLDELSGDKQFLDIRKRRPAYRTLTKIDDRTREFYTARDQDLARMQEAIDKAERAGLDDLAKISKRIERESAKGQSAKEIVGRLGAEMTEKKKVLDANLARLRQEKDFNEAKRRVKLNLDVGRVQNEEKLRAVLLPPILPLVLGTVVFVTRRLRERKGVSSKRHR